MNEEISLELKFDLKEMREMGSINLSRRQTTIIFTNESIAHVDGVFSEIIAKDSVLKEIIEDLVKTKGDRKIWDIGNNDNNQKRHMDILNSLRKSQKEAMVCVGI